MVSVKLQLSVVNFILKKYAIELKVRNLVLQRLMGVVIKRDFDANTSKSVLKLSL